MIDINFYDYSKKPFDEGEKFNIFPLSDEGVSQYYSKDAHTHTFLDKLNPRKMEQIYQEKGELDNYMRTVMEDREMKRQEFLTKINSNKNANNTNPNLNDDKNYLNENYDLKNEENDKDFNIQENYNYEPRNDQRNSNNNHIRSHTTDPYNKGKSSNNNANNGATRYGFSNTKFRPQPLDEKLACFGKSTYGKLVQSKLSTSHLYQNQPRTRYCMNESQTQPYIPSYIMRTKKKIGFESYNIPRVAPNNKLKPIQVSQFDNRCYKSLSGFFDSNHSDIHTYLDKENERLGNILLNQTSEGFLRSNRLPKISFIVNQPDIIVKKTKVGNSKFLGNQYNPFNYNPANSKNLTKRNIYGSLFQH